MDLKEFYNNLKLFYNKTSEVFEKLFTTYFFVCYDISEYEKVYVVETSSNKSTSKPVIFKLFVQVKV